MYLYKRDYDLIDLLIPHQDRYEVIIEDGVSGDSGDEYGISINEKPTYSKSISDPSFYDGPGEDFQRHFSKAAVVEDGSPGSDSSSTIASDLASEINTIYDEATASASGSIVTIEPSDRYSYMDLHVETFTSDEEGQIQTKPAHPESYEVQRASNWDGSFTTMETVPQRGIVSDNVKEPLPSGGENTELKNATRFRFDPSDYSLYDSTSQFFKIAPVINGTTQSAGPINIVLSSEHLYQHHPALHLVGQAPIAADVSGSIQLNFPRQTTSVDIENTGSSAELIHYTWGSNDAERTLSQGESFSDNKLSTDSVKVRTDGSASSSVEVEIYVTLNVSEIAG
jgi:hypothetical protein